jgi:hypothetical protein
MAGILTKLLGSIPQLIQNFANIFQMSVVQAVLLLCGAVVLAFAVIVFGYLTLGAVLRPVGGLPAIGRGQRDQ